MQAVRVIGRKKIKFLFFVFICPFYHPFLPRTSLTHPSMFTGLVFLESLAVTGAANAGISLSTALNVQLPCQLKVLCTCVSAILRGTVITSTKAMCAWDSGSVIVRDTVEVMTPTQARIQCPGSLSKKFLSLRLRS